MIAAILLLLACQLVGEATARVTGLPVPGPVLGLVLLVGCLAFHAKLRPNAPTVDQTPLGVVSGVLLTNLSLLFVPAGTGIVGQIGTLMSHGAGLLIALVVSTALTLCAVAIVFRVVSRITGSDSDAIETEPSTGHER